MAQAQGIPALALPEDAWLRVCEHLRPCDLCACLCVCKDLAAAADDRILWSSLLRNAVSAAIEGLVEPRTLAADVRATRLETGPAVVAEVLEQALTMSRAATVPPRIAYFHTIPFVAPAAVGILSQLAPRLCLVSLESRAYDTTDFVEHHPGGSHLMQQHHGKDTTTIFEAFPHSSYAHDMMQHKMLRFDGVAHVGRYGAPLVASLHLPRTWSRALMDEAASLLQPLLPQLVTKTSSMRVAASCTMAGSLLLSLVLGGGFLDGGR